MALTLIWMFYKISNLEKQSALLHYVLRNRVIDEAIKACNEEAEREELTDRFDRRSIKNAHFTFAILPEPMMDGEMSLWTPFTPPRSPELECRYSFLGRAQVFPPDPDIPEEPER